LSNGCQDNGFRSIIGRWFMPPGTPFFVPGESQSRARHAVPPGEATHQGVTGDLIDAWMIARPGEDGFTSDAQNPDHRIDYLLMQIYASDHLGVLCRFEM
jgi:hypothetical protein